MKRVLAVIPLVLLASAGLAACGGSSTKTAAGTTTVTVTATATVTASASAVSQESASTSAAPAGQTQPSACALLTLAEAEKVASAPLTKPVGAGKTASGGYVECEFTTSPSGPLAQVEVYVGDGAAQQLHIDRDNLHHAFKTIPGIGDQCVQEEGFIFMQKNGLWASIRLVRMDDPKLHVIPLQTGAKLVASRLP